MHERLERLAGVVTVDDMASEILALGGGRDD